MVIGRIVADKVAMHIIDYINVYFIHFSAMLNVRKYTYRDQNYLKYMISYM